MSLKQRSGSWTSWAQKKNIYNKKGKPSISILLPDPNNPGTASQQAESSDLYQKRLSSRLSKKKGIRDLNSSRYWQILTLHKHSEGFWCYPFTPMLFPSRKGWTQMLAQTDNICTDPELRKLISSTALQEQLTEINSCRYMGPEIIRYTTPSRYHVYNSVTAQVNLINTESKSPESRIAARQPTPLPEPALFIL